MILFFGAKKYGNKILADGVITTWHRSARETGRAVIDGII
jgi:hypothetical protein